MIEERIREKLTVETLADGVNFSRYHYQRIFREAVGDTVMGYVTRRRLFLAAEELAGTEDSVLEIALRYGYDSHEGFSRSFKAHLGVTPTEYRKYHPFIGLPEKGKERYTMTHAKHTEEVVKELNSLIVRARETAANTRRYRAAHDQAAALYGQVWDLAAGRAEKMAEELGAILERAAAASQGPEEIAARLQMVKAIDDTAFAAGVTAFQTGLVIARAMPEHRAAYQPLCEQYDLLARDAQIKSRKMAGFLRELSQLILQEMRDEASRRIQSAVRAGRAAAEKLSDGTLPYGYIAEEVTAIAEELDAMALEDVTLSSLRDAASRLETIRFAAGMDILRAPEHRRLFDGLSELGERLEEAAAFFQDLAGGGIRSLSENAPAEEPERARIWRDLAMRECVTLFYLKGELQKLGDAGLDEERQAAFRAICGKLDRAIKLSLGAADGGERTEIEALFEEAGDELAEEAERLGPCGGAVRYLAEEVKKPLRYLMREQGE